jgi:hypothetical protein
MYIKRLTGNFVQKALLFFIYKVLKFIVDQIPTPRLADMGSRQLPDSPIRRVSDSPIRGVYKRKNKSLRSLCVPFVAGISGPAKTCLR